MFLCIAGQTSEAKGQLWEAGEQAKRQGQRSDGQVEGPAGKREWDAAQVGGEVQRVDWQLCGDVWSGW